MAFESFNRILSCTLFRNKRWNNNYQHHVLNYKFIVEVDHWLLKRCTHSIFSFNRKNYKSKITKLLLSLTFDVFCVFLCITVFACCFYWKVTHQILYCLLLFLIWQLLSECQCLWLQYRIELIIVLFIQLLESIPLTS